MTSDAVNSIALTIGVSPQLLEDRFLRAQDTWKRLTSDRQSDRRNEYLASISNIHKTGVVAEFLYRYYELDPVRSQNLFRIASFTYPLFVRPEWLTEAEPDEVLEKPLRNDEYVMREMDLVSRLKDAYLEYVKSTGRDAFDAQTYRLTGVHVEGGRLQLACAMGTYFTYLATCESLADELLIELGNRQLFDSHALSEHGELSMNPNVFVEIAQRLPIRMLFAPSIDTLSNVALRDSKIGLNVFFAMRTTAGPICLLYKRGKNVAEYPDLYHVAPAGTFQHDGRNELPFDQCTKAYSIRYKVLSELWEECFEGESRRSQKKMKWGGRIDFDQAVAPGTHFKPINDIIIALEKKTALMRMTGMGIDLLSAKPEIAVALIVTDPEFADKYHDYFKFNWEFPGFETESGSDDGVYYCPLDDASKIRDLMRPGVMIPGGAMALARGFELLHQLRSRGDIDWRVATL